MRAFVFSLLSAGLILSAGCVGRVDGNETFIEDRRHDAGTKHNAPDGGKTQGEAGASVAGHPGHCENQPLAKGLRIREVSLFQSVKVTLYEPKRKWIAPDDRTAVVVEGKDALVRIMVDHLPGYESHPVRGVLRIVRNGQPEQLEDLKEVALASTEENLDTSFNFEVKGELIDGSTELSVALEEEDCQSESGESDDTTSLPDGYAPLNALHIEKLRVVIVPVEANGRKPITDAKAIEDIRNTLRAFYPVPDVEIQVRPVLEWPYEIGALNMKGWLDLLNQIVRERQRDNVDRDVYYYGMVQPSASFMQYCPNGCILGLAPQTERRVESMQVAAGASFAISSSYETMVHELGHAHGRQHSPCNETSDTLDVDPYFPNEEGSIDDWGWDSRSKLLKAPSENKDVMGYCSPNWVSAYTYNGLAYRSLEVNGQLLLVNSKLVLSWENVLLYADGSARWGGVSEKMMPVGNNEPAEVLDAAGQVIDETEVIRIPISHAGDAFLYIPRPAANWAAIKMRDRRLVLKEIAPAI